MSDEVEAGPVDNSHRDAGIAARDSQKEAAAAVEAAKVEAKQEAAPKPEQAEAATATTEGDESQNSSEESAGSESGDAPAQQARKKPGVHQRIDELTKARYDAERERDYWREQASRQSQQPQQAQTPQVESSEPTLESCDFDVAEFNRKWYAWRKSEDQRVEAHQQRASKLKESESAFRAEHPDYDAVAYNPALPITDAMAEVIAETDDPAAVAYHLGQNPHEAASIAQMTPHQIGRAIGRIEAKLSAPPAAPVPPPRQPEPKTVTKAPPPVTTLSGAPAIHKAVDDMSMAEYDAHRRAERAAKGLPP